MEGDGDLLLHVVDDILYNNGDPVIVIVALIDLVSVIAGINDADKLDDYILDSVSVWLIKNIHTIHLAALLIIREDKVHNVFDLIF